MRRLLSLTAALALLAFAGCGGDDETTAAAGTSGATGAQDTGSDAGMTAEQFIDASIPDQIREVRDLVDANPDCAAVDPQPGGDFQVAVAINTAQASPDTPLSEIVADQCAKG